MMKVTLFVPVLNELEGMKEILPQVPTELFEQILIVDGKSTDGTVPWVQSQGYDLVIQDKKGLRNAYAEAWPHIKGNYVITFSPDGNCKPSDLKKIIDKLAEGYDMVIASRYYDGAKSEDDDLLTGFGNWMFTAFINLLHRGKLTDALTIYRGYRTRLFTDLDIHKDESHTAERFFKTHVGIEPLLSIRALKCRLKIAEVGSDEPKRKYGVRKLQVFRWGATFLLQVVEELFKWKPRKIKLTETYGSGARINGTQPRVR